MLLDQDALENLNLTIHAERQSLWIYLDVWMTCNRKLKIYLLLLEYSNLKMNQSLPESKKMDKHKQRMNQNVWKKRRLLQTALPGKAMSYHNNIRNISRISTGARRLDAILYGGIETHAITEFYGASGTGKTQICHALAVMAIGEGLHGNVIFVDTQGTFRPERIVSIADARGFNASLTLSNILYTNAMTSHKQELMIDRISSLGKNYKNTRLLIVDSVIGNYRAEFLGTCMLSQRQQRLYKFMRKLISIARSHGIAVVITNQVNSRGRYSLGDNPTGGNIMASTSTYRVHLRRFYNNRSIIVARIVKSPYHPDKETYFSLGEKGLEDNLQI